ncbi:MAG: AraC family transcriptional regulator [Cyanobacteria bacterium P01_F01_bin.143]
MNKKSIFEPYPQNPYNSSEQRNLVVFHYQDFRTQMEIELAKTTYHLLGYLLTGQHPQQFTRIGDREYTIDALSSDIFLKPATYSAFWTCTEPDDSLLFWIRPSFLSELAEQNELINANKVELLPLPQHQDAILNNLVALFQQEMNSDYSEGQIYEESLSNLLGIHLLRHYCVFPTKATEYSGGLARNKLKRVLDYINEHLADDISLSELAKQAKLSQSHFSTLFRQSTGKSPYRFVTEQRVARAQELLLNTDMTVLDIAVAVGFYDQTHLRRHMKKLRGISPKQLRE